MHSSNIVRQKSKIIRNLVIALISLAVAVVFAFFLISFIKSKTKDAPSTQAILSAWSEYNYQNVYTLTASILAENPFNNFALTYHGYASFYLAVSQLDTALAQDYLDEAIFSMRNALTSARKKLIPQLEYMLGKSYFYKNTVTSYYYADLAVKYLSLAKEHGYKADDIPEYLGLSYASLGNSMESISSFTEALLVRESDTLLLSIAEQYFKTGQTTVAKQYLYRVINESTDENLVLRSHSLLGNIYIEENKLTEAKAEFESILKKNQNSADAYYGIGVIYEKQGDLVKARAEWRKALRLQVNHPGALLKMADYN